MAIKKTTRSRQNCNYGSDFPPEHACKNGVCVPWAKPPGIFGNTSAKIGAGIIGTGVTALGAKVAKDIKQNRAAKKEVKKTVDKAAKSITSTKVMKKGGSTGDKKWIQKAINPAHKGYCTPMSKPTCTPKRKALAITLKKMAKKK